MDLACSPARGVRFVSRAQIARIATESWCNREMYCPACVSDRLQQTPTNFPVVDFVCPDCSEEFQLKSMCKWSETRVVDGGYEAMTRAIRADKVPNLFLLHYGDTWTVRNLLVIPRFCFPEAAVERRKPLGPMARRAGWIGCNILLSRIPPHGKLAIVRDGIVSVKSQVRRGYKEIAALEHLKVPARGWTLDVLTTISKLHKREFSLNEVYAREDELKDIHPANRNIRPKIRQQLQVLRDIGVVSFLGTGIYRLNHQ